ncbi:methionine ABC transporter ATP-binding protein [Anaerobacillus isosaccharinicus]|uniref:Methionine ABC transporter ATP-binding protein n=1 Tax=Anaerobacillus isosaccharinicus TaxID=1532552 RepID=A0A1S2KVW3_9BACI|nr:methionine ABC transporter ATP-binding protein [Anaerobacillus isosaccharinicus]MBA5584797.1 methionine ABC transporter ATP-binding protein [Anaerobacillus isosaccharinicus]QOY36838.1 methionine ABC transporter ATP-binding protein [Anaerobacillus isosaccharinicus]
MITLSSLKKIFQTKDGIVTAVDNINLMINEGEIYGIIGYSGAGKSTLIRMLNMLERPSAGTVQVAGKNLSQLSKKELRLARQEISMIFQHFNLLWSRTVRENISFPLEIAGVPKEKRKERVEELIKLVGLEGRGESYPSQLSGGQKQRVGIARALANNPKVLLCDEATSALDPKTTDSILDLLVDINQKLGLTIVLITHEMHVIRKICHRVAVMENGNIVEEGPVLEVFRQPTQEMTKEFVKQVTEPEETVETVKHLLEETNTGKIVQLTFVGGDAEKPLITEMIRAFNIDINILQGKISHTQNGPYGALFVHIDGEDTEVEKAIEFVREKQVKVEVISNV